MHFAGLPCKNAKIHAPGLDVRTDFDIADLWNFIALIIFIVEAKTIRRPYTSGAQPSSFKKVVGQLAAPADNITGLTLYLKAAEQTYAK